MKGYNIFKRFWIALGLRPIEYVLSVLFSFGLLWSVLEPIVQFLKPDIGGGYKFLVFFIICLIIGAYRITPPRKIKIRIKNTNTRVEIKFSDLFQETGHKIISVNEYFDSELGKPVSPQSLHGIFIQKILGGHKRILDEAIDTQLKVTPHEVVNREMGKDKKFKIGTTIFVEHDNNLYYLVALAKTDENYKAYTNPSLLLEAMEGLWKKVRNECNGNPVNIPLIGSGLAGIGIPPTQIIELILISILKAAKEQDLSTTINLILLPSFYEEVQLDLIKKNWQ